MVSYINLVEVLPCIVRDLDNVIEDNLTLCLCLREDGSFDFTMIFQYLNINIVQEHGFEVRSLKRICATLLNCTLMHILEQVHAQALPKTFSHLYN